QRANLDTVSDRRSFRERVVGQKDGDLGDARPHAIERDAVPAPALSAERVLQHLRVEAKQHSGAPRPLVSRPVWQPRVIRVSAARELDPRLLNLTHQRRPLRPAPDEVDGLKLVDQSKYEG